jgi:hypothetical protein
MYVTICENACEECLAMRLARSPLPTCDNWNLVLVVINCNIYTLCSLSIKCYFLRLVRAIKIFLFSGCNGNDGNDGNKHNPE